MLQQQFFVCIMIQSYNSRMNPGFSNGTIQTAGKHIFIPAYMFYNTTAQNEPEGTTELLEQAGNGSRLLGRLYNGTPLYVLERGTEWTKVRIGHGEGSGTITGWMRTKDLAFGDDTLRISRETIRLRSEQVLIHPVESFVGSRAGKITSEQFSSCLVIGEAEAGQSYAVIYYLWDGDVGLVPTAGLGNGNG